MNDLVVLLISLIPDVPFLIIYVVGATLSMLRWRYHPALSRLAFFAFLLFAGRLVFGSTLRHWLLLKKSAFGWDNETLGLYLAIVNGFSLLIGIIAWVLLLVALFFRRDQTMPMVAQDRAEGFWRHF